eukprot:scaffold189872_cov27-Tisochrysis_lutea.AAC.1
MDESVGRVWGRRGGLWPRDGRGKGLAGKAQVQLATHQRVSQCVGSAARPAGRSEHGRREAGWVGGDFACTPVREAAVVRDVKSGLADAPVLNQPLLPGALSPSVSSALSFRRAFPAPRANPRPPLPLPPDERPPILRVDAHGLPNQQPDPRIQQLRLRGQMARGLPEPFVHQQLPRVHGPRVPCAMRRCVRRRTGRQGGDDQEYGVCNHRPRMEGGLGQAAAASPPLGQEGRRRGLGPCRARCGRRAQQEVRPHRHRL